MNPFLAAACGLSLLSSGLTQNYASSPPGFLGQPGGDEASYLGAFSYGRRMVVDGELPRRTLTLQEVAYRPLPRLPSIGRTFQRVTIQASECDFDKIDWTGSWVEFAKVPNRVPTTVFDARTTFPRVRQGSQFDWRVRFPFNTGWIYSGQSDLCLDHSFHGGTLDGHTTPWPRHENKPYHLDTTPMEFSVTNTGSTTVRNRVCVGHNGLRADARLTITSYGPMYWLHPQFRGLMVASTVTQTARLTPVAHMFSLHGSVNGVRTPLVACEDLFLDFSKPVSCAVVTSYAGGSAYLSCPLKYDAGQAGTRVWIQAAWNDPATGALKLTPYSTTVVPRLPTFYRRGVIKIGDNRNSRGISTLESHEVPMARYAY